MSGTMPGTIVQASAPPLGPTFASPHSSFVLPLNTDAYFNHTLGNPGFPLLQAVGFLDTNAQATVTFTWPPGLAPLLAGTTFEHAFVLIDDLFFSSNTAAVTLLP